MDGCFVGANQEKKGKGGQVDGVNGSTVVDIFDFMEPVLDASFDVRQCAISQKTVGASHVTQGKVSTTGTLSGISKRAGSLFRQNVLRRRYVHLRNGAPSSGVMVEAFQTSETVFERAF